MCTCICVEYDMARSEMPCVLVLSLLVLLCRSPHLSAARRGRWNRSGLQLLRVSPRKGSSVWAGIGGRKSDVRSCVRWKWQEDIQGVEWMRFGHGRNLFGAPDVRTRYCQVCSRDFQCSV